MEGVLKWNCLLSGFVRVHSCLIHELLYIMCSSCNWRLWYWLGWNYCIHKSCCVLHFTDLSGAALSYGKLTLQDFWLDFVVADRFFKVCNKTPGSQPNRCSLQSLKFVKCEQVSNVIRTCLERSQTLRYFQTCLILSPPDLVVWLSQ